MFICTVYLFVFIFLYFLRNLHVSGYFTHPFSFHNVKDMESHTKFLYWLAYNAFTAHHSVQWCTRLSLIIMYLTYIIHAPLCNAVGITVWEARPKIQD